MTQTTLSTAPVESALLRGFMERIDDRTAQVAVIGLGYVGLPLALAFAERGFPVLGFDIDADKLTRLERGDSYIAHLDGGQLRELHEAGRLRLTDRPGPLGEADAILMCVPTPLTRHREPDVSAVLDSTEMLASVLRRGQLVALESTSYPGTTDELVKPILERGGLRAGTDFFLAYSPEREDPGNRQFRTASIPKVLGADDAVSRAAAEKLYSEIVPGLVTVSNSRTAEAVKLTENIFRSVNIALANELKVIYGEMGIDVWEVIDAAKTKPFGFMPFYPGPGLGGHCIPIDPFYLTWKAREYEVATRFIELAGEINTAMPRYVLARLAEALNRTSGRGLNGARVLLIGVAYKKNVNDTRETPAFPLIDLIEAQGAEVAFHDPLVPEIPRTRHFPHLQGRRSVGLTRTALSTFDAVLICTDHDEIDYAMLAAHARLVVDTRNALGYRGHKGQHIVRA